MRSLLKDYLELTKPRVTALVVLTAWLGFALAAPRSGPHFSPLLVHMLLGTWLAAAGASALNQYMERDLDARMRRTQNRPLPRQRLTPRQALVLGAILAAGGTLELAIEVNILTALLAAFTINTYLFFYTPLKTKTSLCTLIGAVPGAIPPMMGWAAVRGQLDQEAWVLFAILFLWQLPHFLAIAWMYREDYARAGFPMLPVLDRQGGLTGGMIILYCAILIPVTLIPVLMGLSGCSYFYGALGLGLAFLFCGIRTAFYRRFGNRHDVCDVGRQLHNHRFFRGRLDGLCDGACGVGVR